MKMLRDLAWGLFLVSFLALVGCIIAFIVYDNSDMPVDTTHLVIATVVFIATTVIGFIGSRPSKKN
jgi:uncharacterized membrane protein YoaT (DUF817 family)